MSKYDQKIILINRSFDEVKAVDGKRIVHQLKYINPLSTAVKMVNSLLSDED